MAMEGTLAALTGNLSTIYAQDGDSAYEIAKKNGFEGTEEAWLASLKGETGNSGVYFGSGKMPDDCDVQIDPNGTPITIDYIISRLVSLGNKISTVKLLDGAWNGDESPYSQVVTIAGATANSKIDLNPTVEQLDIFHDKDISFVVENDDGVITVYCIGQKPTQDYEMQVTITEVAKNE